jgi:hypothetical protein
VRQRHVRRCEPLLGLRFLHLRWIHHGFVRFNRR